MNLYKITGASYEAFFGVPAFDIARDDVTIIAQTPNCDAFLFLSNEEEDALNGLTLLDTVPSGFHFTYNQSWGLEVNQTKIDRVIAELG